MPQVMRPETFEERLYRKVCVFDVGVVDGVVDWRLQTFFIMFSIIRSSLLFTNQSHGN